MNALTLSGVTKRYDDFCLDHIDLALPEGSIVGLVGENGAGKTTLIKLILAMTTPDAGDITLLGASDRSQFAQVRDDIGVVLDNVGLPGHLTTKHIGRIMAATFSRWDQEVFASLLDQLSIPQDKQFRKFSRGTRMKLGIAVALSHHPRLLLLDEATSGLDPIVRDQVLDLLCAFTRDAGHTVLLSSHIVSDLEKICDYIAFLHQGKLLLFAEKDRLAEHYGLLHCSADELQALPPSAVVGARSTPYGTDAVVHRDRIPRDMTVSPVGLEELFILMTKEAH